MTTGTSNKTIRIKTTIAADSRSHSRNADFRIRNVLRPKCLGVLRSPNPQTRLLNTPVCIVIVVVAPTEESVAVYKLLGPPPTQFEIGHDGTVAVHVDGGCSRVHICNCAYIASPVDKVIASI